MHNNLSKYMEIYEIHKKTMDYDESPQRTRSQPGIEQRFLEGQQVLSYRCNTHAPKTMKIYNL